MELKCKHYPGELWKLDSLTYIDQLSDDIVEVSARKLNKYLRDTYNINAQQYYNLIMGYDIDYCPKCRNPECILDTNFQGLLIGYAKFCGNSCRSIYNNKVMWKDEAYRNKMSAASSERLSEYNRQQWADPISRQKRIATISKSSKHQWNNKEYRDSMMEHLSNNGRITCNTPESQASLILAKYPLDKPDWFYLARATYAFDWLKIGRCTNPVSRALNGSEYSRMYAIKTTLEKSTKIECELKRLILDNNYNSTDPVSSEWFTIDHFRSMLKSIREVLIKYDLDISNFVRIKVKE